MPQKKNIDPTAHGLIDLLKSVEPFTDLTEPELRAIAAILKKIEYQSGENVITEGETGSTAYIVDDGTFRLNIGDQKTRDFVHGDFFGEIALIDTRPRMGTVQAVTTATLYCIEAADLDNDKIIDPRTAMKIYRGFSRLISSYMREGATLYKKMEVLLIQDGGCAPGYNPVTAFISEALEKAGHDVYICATGFKSLISNKPQDYRRLIYSSALYRKLEHLPGVIFSPPLRESRGADFRTERFPEFKEVFNQKQAAESIIGRDVNVVVGIGGNGTFAGVRALGGYLPDRIQMFFVPVTIDSDIWGTDCIGEFTGVEVGSEKIRCYMADSRTHKRIYIIEMMGARGGYHALHSCLGAGAHLAVVPFSRFDLKMLGRALQERDNAVIVVAEGYKSDERKSQGFTGNAAEYFYQELIDAGFSSGHRVICEPFSRDVRGAKPNNLDIMLAQRMARKLAALIREGKSRMMPAVLSGKEYCIPFDEIRTDNSVESDLASLANRLLPVLCSRSRKVSLKSKNTIQGQLNRSILAD